MQVVLLICLMKSYGKWFSKKKKKIFRKVVRAFLFINHTPRVGDLLFCRLRKKINYAVIENISEDFFLILFYISLINLHDNPRLRCFCYFGHCVHGIQSSSLYVQRTLMFVYFYQNRTGQVQPVSIVWREIFTCCKEHGF